MTLRRLSFAVMLSAALLAQGPALLLAQDTITRPRSTPVPLTPRNRKVRRITDAQPSREGVEPELTTPGAPIPGESPQLPRFETGIDVQPATGPGERITFNLEDAELTDLVRLISSITGKAFIIPNKTRQVKATIYAPEQGHRGRGLSRVPLDPGAQRHCRWCRPERYLKIVESQGVETKTIPLYINKNVPSEDRFMTSLVRVTYVSAEDVANLLGRFKSREGNVTAYAPTNTVIITDTGTNIRRMQRIVNAIDIERGGEQLWIEPVHHATASDIAARLVEIFPLTSSDPAKAAANRSIPPPAPPAGGKPTAIGAAGGGFRVTNILPDERTNSLVIMATEAAYLRILELIRHLDVPLDGDGGIHVHYLQHGDAEEIAKTLTTLIGGTTKRNAGGAAKPGQASPDAVFEGNIAVTAHEPTNSLVITSSLHDYAALKGVIDRLDSERRQVFIEAVVVNLDVTNQRTFGLSYFTGVPNMPTDGSVGVAGYQNSLGSLTSGLPGIAGAVTAAGGADALSGLALGIQGPAITGGPAGLSIPSFGMALAAHGLERRQRRARHAAPARAQQRGGRDQHRPERAAAGQRGWRWSGQPGRARWPGRRRGPGWRCGRARRSGRARRPGRLRHRAARRRRHAHPRHAAHQRERRDPPRARGGDLRRRRARSPTATSARCRSTSARPRPSSWCAISRRS